MKIFLNEIGAFLIDRVDEVLGFRLRFAARQQAPHLLPLWGVEKYPQGVRAIPALALNSFGPAQEGAAT